MYRLLLIPALTLGLALSVQANDQVEATLHADTTTVLGKPFKVGVMLKMIPHWHTYFSNPGDAGLATRVKWQLPSGYKAGELQFPTPSKIEDPGGITVYGYEDEVMLLTTITPPQDASGPVDLKADVSWLCCAENCVPGKAQLELKLDGGAPDPADKKLFKKWTRLIPAFAGTTAPITLSEAGAAVTIDLHSNLVSDYGFAVPGAADGLAVTIDTPKTGDTITVQVKKLQGATVTVKSLPIFISYPSAGTGRMGEQFDIPLKQ